ncbi:MAG: multicopper oxidase domain-containing protein [Thermoleophilia bacterium]|jgi:FtsP/CotA-like multicopper oxidase with cupredoxin domain|nr:multicopper oxidase domain-containing protein [Thermoleophilia bacterium]
MSRRRSIILITLAVMLIAVIAGAVVTQAAADKAPKDLLKEKAAQVREKMDNRVTQADREAAAARAAADGLTLPTAVTAAMAMAGEAPHYFSVANYANSQLPMVESGVATTVGNALVERANASDSAANVFVVVPTPLPDGLIQSFDTFNQTAGSNSPSEGKSFHAYVLRPTGTADEYQVVFDSGLFTVPAATDPAGNVEHFAVPNIAVQAGDVLAFYGQGIPLDIGAGADILAYPAPTAPLQDGTITLGGAEYPIFPQAREYSFGASVIDMADVTITGGIRKFVDELPLLDAAGANNLGQFIPVAVPDTTTYPGSDYYEIAVIQYSEKMHSDIPATLLRGYVQLATDVVPGDQVPLSNELRDGTLVDTARFGVTAPHYLGPLINATKDKPVRIKFVNLLPNGVEGNLFIPMDPTVMGAGMGPYGMDPDMPMEEEDPLNPMAGMLPKPYGAYTENRAVVHLHGGITPWISDGTPHQWITPAGEDTPYPEGVSVKGVPDMENTDDPADGETTLYYTNQQSARLMFYHDHSWGITRLNVYAGEAAPYLIHDPKEQELVDGGYIPAPEDTIPLVVQDKTFVPDMMQLAMQDPTWDMTRWGGEGDLWLPHVYSPAQNPGDSSGVNEFGRWAYGPWFWPPTVGIKYGPVDNPYYDPNADPDLGWVEPPLMPGVPFNSMGMEAFMDTPVINGTAYPTTTVEPKAYRFRILNAANDRFFNLSLYVADASGTEVALNAAEVAAALEDTAVFPTPDTALSPAGPDWVQIGTEGGFLPAPTVIPAQHITWVNDPTVFNAGNVDQHSLLIAPAERADVVVDFSAYAGQTLILYNDAPAAFPARDARYDYYTGSADLTSTGGVPPVQPGYGPNTRTIMQIKVADAAPAPAFDVAGLENAFKSTELGGLGVFENGQKPIVVGQAPYNSAYNETFKTNGPDAGLVQIFNTSFTFKTLLNGATGESMTMPLQPKQIQDEMGEAFERDYGRMSGFLGVETPNAQAGLQNMILYSFTHPPDMVLKGIELPEGTEAQPIASADDGTQIWKFTHNGVDTHPIHFHLYDVQLINRVGWDGIIRRPDPNELGWKDTVRISPLEDTIVALRPIVPSVPWDLPNSIRLLDPSMPEGAMLANTTAQEAAGLPIFAFNPDGEPIDIVNHYMNFGWEYVVHCHILSHEEMDMMRGQAVAIAPDAPTDIAWVTTGNGNNRVTNVTWTDASVNETAFVIERATSEIGPWLPLATLESDRDVVGPGTGPRSYTDPVGRDRTAYVYRVFAVNTVGDTWDYADPNLNEIVSGGFPTVTVDSRGPAATALPAPSGLTATLGGTQGRPTVALQWTDNSDETGFLIQRAEDAAFTLNVTNATIAADLTTFTQNVARGKTYHYRMLAFSPTSQSDWSNVASVTTP